ncbi:glycosyl hydrolase family 65 protein [Methylobacterium isbiliense]|uniref:Kojibiose phosphorylase n=1 Tax=Methylobacterium isbiliense TaxID=315478 RepID=A0ABQ4SE20_9HYPH|nr:glycosyl hydrolase family 65 protein [Methylobacterium isbiliense]MDN3621828.1 glycosyl hydrolase family 65 protein [Methylobacterium isbiliense]GJD99930.1 Kojibiose phosphorylase [Methylobacterium isbiliense]
MPEVLRPTPDSGWTLAHDGYSVTTESAVESRFAFGNGFLGMRAARSVSRGPTWASWLGYIRWASWPRCYVAGLFDMPNTEPAVPALVPVADWSRVRIVLDGATLAAREGAMLHGTRTLDLRRGVLLADWAHRTPAGVTFRGRELRLLSLADRAVGLQILRIALDRDEVEVKLEASFGLAGLGMEPMRLERDLAAWRTEGTAKAVAMAGAARLAHGGAASEPERPFPLRWVWRWRSVAGQAAVFARLVAVARADRPDEDPAPPAAAALARSTALGWRAVLAAHEAAWGERWTMSDVLIEGDDALQRALRFAVYHLTSAANPEDERVSIGARGLTGDAYFGHVFWDTEIYLLPFYTAIWPEAARALLMYRFHTLPGAREKAVRLGYRGALYPWESADTGAETTPDSVLGPNGTPVEILTGKMEHHISADVAYAVWHYWRATGDDDFLLQAGAEILLETARFWVSRAVPEADGRRHIRHVIGPDEYHEDVDDNAFTNVMARWTIARGLEVVALLQARWPERAAALRAALALGDDELAQWRDATARIVDGLDPETGLYEQFAGFHGLDLLDVADYADHALPIDVIIGRERTQGSQVVKQADVVALIALLPQEFPGASAETNFRHYEPRCAHGSSLSASMHALVAARLGQTETALRYMHETASLDLDPDPNSAGGVRIAGLGGLWQAVVRGFGGLTLSGERLEIDPRLPPQWRLLSFRTRWRDRMVAFRITQDGVDARLLAGERMEIGIAGTSVALEVGMAQRVSH